MTLSVSTEQRGAIMSIHAAGDIDLASGPTLENAIVAALDRSAPDGGEIVVDLSEVTFLDSSGIAVLLKGRRLSDARGVDYRIASADGLVRKVLDLTGVWGHLAGPPG